MRLVVDSNIFFAALIKDAYVRKILLHLDSEYFIIPVNRQEIEKYKKELMEKAGLNEPGFEIILEQLTRRCVLLEDRVVLSKWAQAKDIMWKIDPKDTPFIAAALALGADIWSDDAHFSRHEKFSQKFFSYRKERSDVHFARQNASDIGSRADADLRYKKKVKVWKTADLVKLLG